MKPIVLLVLLSVLLLSVPPIAGADGTPDKTTFEWPIDFEFMEPATKRLDRNHDGIEDIEISAYDGGSGWKSWSTCYRDGKSSNVACKTISVTSYSSFSGVKLDFEPAPSDSNRAAHLVSSPCSAPSRSKPSQAAIWTLSKKWRKKLRWFDGRPWVQMPSCIDKKTFSDFDGALIWTGDGSAPGDSWIVKYAPEAVQLDFQSRSKNGHKPLAPIYDGGKFQIYQHGHALAIYWPREDRHAWFFNAESIDAGDYKFDRWNSIASVSSVGKKLKIELAERLGEVEFRSLRSLKPR